MAKYSIKAPDGNTYSIEGPEGASDEQVRSKVMEAYPDAATPKPGRFRQALDKGMEMTKDAVGKVFGPLAAPFEVGAAGASALPKQLGSAATLLSGGSAEDARGTADAIPSYEPQTEAGKSLAGAISYPFKKGEDFLVDQTAKGNIPDGVGASLDVGLNALPMALGEGSGLPKSAARTLAPEKMVAPMANKGANLWDVLRGSKAGDKVGGNYLRKVAGTAEQRAKLADELEKTRIYVQGSKPTAAEAASAIPEGAPVQELQRRVAEMAGPAGAPGKFGRNEKEQEGARAALKEKRDKIGENMRLGALEAANKTGGTFARVTSAITDRFRSKASALQEEGRFDTMKSQQEARAIDQAPEPGPVGSSLAERSAGQGGGKAPATDISSGGPLSREAADAANAGPGTPRASGPGFSSPSRDAQIPLKSGAAPRAPARYTPHAERAEEAGAASKEMKPVIEMRQKQLASAEARLKELEASGAKPATINSVMGQIDNILKDPALGASDVVVKAMASIQTKLESLAAKDGGIDAKSLYTVRRELGTYIESAAKENANWDKALTGSLERNLQRAFDDELDQASGGKWKPYLRTYSRISKAIEMDEARSSGKYKPETQNSRLGEMGSAISGPYDEAPHIMSRKASSFNWLLGGRRKALEEGVQSHLTDTLFDPKKTAAELRKGLVPEDQNAFNRQLIEQAVRAGYLPAQAALIGQQGQQGPQQ
jgi:hypothetical protein